MPTQIITNMLAASLLFSFIPMDIKVHSPQAVHLEHSKGMENINDEKGLEEIAIGLADDFILPLNPANDDLKTKEDFINYYRNISDLDLAGEFLNTFFIEKNGVLEHIPTEPPLWFDSKLPYEFRQISETEMIISQYSSTDLHGSATLTIFYKKSAENRWVINDVQYGMEQETLNEV
ncbi:hypothetical protein D4T97_015110 [Siminovitchia acidinfaciens]|uniref:Uncharacterized protein n=1 Tax=Siminovitchia acidinfaciens TaxID=2321395 RepID=A0A429XWH6_9BACI|nr:hypothetical protein [Siminovitchia acidinfaciens]RST72746.1 hypothetical protein D4T97_015110 [Siminovitchia acidinfaciens]